MDGQMKVSQVPGTPRDCIADTIEILGKIPVPIELDEMIRQPVKIARDNLIGFLQWFDQLKARVDAEHEATTGEDQAEVSGDVQT